MTAKILLVDDVTMFVELQKGFLKQSSAKVLTARDGLEALDLVKQERPDLIFMDLHMPRLDGAECCARLKADPILRHIPVILITADKAEDRLLCQQAGCDAFLAKPIDRLEYLTTARRYLPAIDRRSKRVPCRFKVSFRAYGLGLSGEALDISDNGIYLATGYEVRVGTPLEVEFILAEARDPLVRVKGRVAWLNSKGEKRKAVVPEGFGVEFVEVPEAVRAALVHFVESHE
jgi:uncharacterized protein (TIGR02266 family)